jgi:hypothetical protein
VDRRADRLCDTVHYTGTRRPPATVLLADLRCDGSAHGGCQAECRYLWKEKWLRRVAADAPPSGPVAERDREALVERTRGHVRYTVDVQGRRQERWRCQATALPEATEPLRLWDVRSYVREYVHGNVGLGRFLRVVARAMVEEPMRKLGLVSEVHLPGTAAEPVEEPGLDLQPGELVHVKTKDEIAATLGPEGRHRGLWFDREMMAFCGGAFRVRQRIHRFIDDRDGRMIELKKNGCVTLEGVVCSGDLSRRRWFCAREIYSYWRECWLRRADPPAESVPAGGGAPAART